MDNGKRLYQTVPAHYRVTDNGDLKKYFAACGVLLDQMQATLAQKYADNFADNPLDGSAPCQDWLIPYFAALFDVRLVSPLVQGRRDEVANAVRWRQGKGSLRTCEEIAEAIGQLEVIVQEGWQRVAVTARLNTPRLPASVFGLGQPVPASPPSIAAKHPGLPALSVDFRVPSGAIASTSNNTAAQESTIDGDTRLWRQANQHGAPCHPGHFDDVSARTVDFRCPDWRVGHYHPDRLLFYTLPPAGFFDPRVPTVNWSETPSAAFLDLIEVIEQGDKTIYRNKSLNTPHFMPVKIRLQIKLAQQPDGVGPADLHTWRFEGLILDSTLEADSGRVELYRCAARKIQVHSIDEEQPVISARSCLFKRLQAARGLTRLEYCTVLETTLSEVLQASDCLFSGVIRKDHPTLAPPDNGCLRYSRVLPTQAQGGMRYTQVNSDGVHFFNAQFGQRSCAVLHPASAQAVRKGAEDGTEIGAFHDQYHSLLADAVVDKLTDYLPVGVDAVVIPDAQILAIPE